MGAPAGVSERPLLAAVAEACSRSTSSFWHSCCTHSQAYSQSLRTLLAWIPGRGCRNMSLVKSCCLVRWTV